PMTYTRSVCVGHTMLSFLFTDPSTPDNYTLSLHDALPISRGTAPDRALRRQGFQVPSAVPGVLPGRPDGVSAVRGHRGSEAPVADRKSTRLNSSHVKISYAVFCLKKKKSMAGIFNSLARVI